MPAGYSPPFWRDTPRDSRQPVTHRPYLPPVYNMNRLKELLSELDPDAKAIPWANTPIVKFSAVTGVGQTLDCDICVNDLGGW